MRIAVNFARVFTGILFIFSGLVKAIDPRGLAYKMQEFFEAFAQSGWLPSLMHSLHDHALTFSIIIITLEVVVGVALLLGWQKKLVVWILLLLIILFTFLTSYVLFSGKIRACGCFGDCIPITPVQTFTKDIILLLLSVFLLFNLKYIRPAMKPMLLTFFMLISTALTLYLQFYVLNHLPLIDCLPFKKGNDIVKLRQMPENAVQDKYDYVFIYQKNNEKKEFKMTELPDSTWEFVDRKQKLIEKGKNNIPLINDFTLSTEEGKDVTTEVLNTPGEYWLIFMKELPDNYKKFRESFIQMSKRLEGKKVYVITAQRPGVEKFLDDSGLSVTGVLTSDAIAIKTAARTNPTVYKMNGPVVQNKWGMADLYKAGK